MALPLSFPAPLGDPLPAIFCSPLKPPVPADRLGGRGAGRRAEEARLMLLGLAENTPLSLQG